MIISKRRKTFLDLFPVPEFLLLSTTGVVIRDTDTRFVQLKRKIFGDGFELVYAGKINNPKGAVESGLINNPNELSNILREFSLLHNVRYVRASIPEERSYLFTVNIDWVPPEGLNDAVAFIVEENVPISLAESIFDFEVIREDKSAGGIKLAVSVLPKNIVNTYVNLFESAGMTPISFDLESRAIARAVISKGDKQTVLIINLSLKKTGFYVVEDGVVQFSTILISGMGGGNSTNFEALLKEEMRKVITFWSTHADQTHSNSRDANKLMPQRRKIEKIILHGFRGHKTDFTDALMSGSEIPYAPADVWLKTAYLKDYPSEMSSNESLGFASAVGLVLPRGE